jgi:hypothetical protein
MSMRSDSSPYQMAMTAYEFIITFSYNSSKAHLSFLWVTSQCFQDVDYILLNGGVSDK